MSNFSNSWEKNRKLGRLKYSIIQGFILSFVVTAIREREVILDLLKGKPNDLSGVFESFAVSLLGAIVGYYFIIWRWKEKLYKKEKQKE